VLERIAGPAGDRGAASAAHLNNWIDDGSKEDRKIEISPY
jgi:hypothetical protein